VLSSECLGARKGTWSELLHTSIRKYKVRSMEQLKMTALVSVLRFAGTQRNALSYPAV
jgi:hypothetical protein